MPDKPAALLERPTAEARSVSELATAAVKGALRMPPFQRAYRWNERDARDLFDSIWRGFPIGSLLLWERPAPAAAVQFGSLQIDAPSTDQALWVVDGQQRLTALVATLVEHPSAESGVRALLRSGGERICQARGASQHAISMATDVSGPRYESASRSLGGTA
jgi:Protein of unknown function DUF262